MQKIRVNSHSREELSKMLLTNAKPTPRVALIDETVLDDQLWPASSKKHLLVLTRVMS